MNTDSRHPLFDSTLELLRGMIALPSFSRQEDAAADFICEWLVSNGHKVIKRLHNNIVAVPDRIAPDKPVLLLNSHIDTVKPSSNYTRNPFEPDIKDGKLFGLGSNDAGASVASLVNIFLSLKNSSELPVNLVLALSAEEEVSGAKGMKALLPYLKELGISPTMAIVGEPTAMAPAIAERGLVVIDAEVVGQSAHVANGNGINALYRAIDDIDRLRNFIPERKSEVLGNIGINVTVIEAGHQHNVVPDNCRYIIDVRTTDAYTNEQTVEMLQQHVHWSKLSPRSTCIQASAISLDHPLVIAAKETGYKPYVSPTVSDRALIHGIPALKIGPGQSCRSHSADEYVTLNEINEGLIGYQQIIYNLKLS